MCRLECTLVVAKARRAQLFGSTITRHDRPDSTFASSSIGWSRSRQAFAETLSAAKNKRLLVPLRGHPDPDGIASALAFGHLATRLGVAQTTIAYLHDLSHRENRALVKLLGLELRKSKA